MVRSLFMLVCVLLSVHFSAISQYLETFSTPNKGYLINNANDFTGVNWTLSSWSADNTTGTFAGRDISDYFRTSASGKLEAIDLDQDVYWQSPELNISTAGTVSFSLGLTWAGLDNDIGGNPCTSGGYGTVATLDIIKVLYSINGGAFTSIPNLRGNATCATVGYNAGSGTGINDVLTVTKGGLSGSKLQIRVLINTNANPELISIDNVSVPQAGVAIIPGGCNGIVVTNPAVTQPTCLAPTGRIIVKATGNGVDVLQYSIDNGATFKATASFPNLAPGSYNILVRYQSNPGCTVPFASNPVVINPVPSLIAPTEIIGPEGVCRNATNQVFSVAPVEGATSYLWILPVGVTGSSTTNSISLSFNATYVSRDLCVKAISPCSQSPQFCRQVKYYGARPVTPDPITGKAIGLCSNQTYSVPPVLNATDYIWTKPAGTTIVSGQGTPQIVLSFQAPFVSGNLSVAAANCKGTSTARVLMLSRNPATPLAITGPTTAVCAGSTKAYSCGLVTGATIYTWTVPAGTIINSGQGTNAISVTFPATFVSGNITVASGTSCSSGTPRSVAITSKPALPAAIVGPASVCPSAVGLQYSTTAVAGVTYNWLVPGSATITSGQGTASIKVTWGNSGGTVRVSANNACGASPNRSLTVGLLSCLTSPVTMAKAGEVKVDEALRLQIWPNPARDILLVTLDAFKPNQKLELSLMQADGRVQQAQSLLPTMKGQQVRLDVRSAAAGYYILLAKQQGMIVSKQVVVVR